MTAGAEILCLLVILRQGHSIGREKFAHRERDVAEQAARIIRIPAGALLLRHTIIIHRHKKLRIPFQPHNGELPQCDIDAAPVIAAAKLTAKALADGRRHLTKITVALSAAAAALHDSGVQNDRVDSLYGLHQVGMQSSSSLQIARYF